MQDYCGEFKSEQVLRSGLSWLRSIGESEGATVTARNPHELMRALECSSRLAVGAMVMEASMARKASSHHLDFRRVDYPATDPPDWSKFITIKQINGEASVGELPFEFWLKPPFASSYPENYSRHSGLEGTDAAPRSQNGGS